MRNQAEDLRGRVFGRLTPVERVEKPQGLSGKRNGAWWRCSCRCGGEKIASANNLKLGNVLSCGCMAKERTALMIAAKKRKAAEKQGAKSADPYHKTGVNGLTAECVCHQCKRHFERLSVDWAYKIRVDDKYKWFCSWRCFRMATAKPKKPHGNSIAARA